VSKFAFPQNISLIETRAESLGVKVVVDDPETYNFEKNKNLCGVFLQTPDNLGRVKDFSSLVERIHKCDSKVIISSDLLSLTLCKPAGEMGADIAIGSNQRFGLPMGFGGPHAGYMSVKKELMRKMPGRIIGISIDNEGRSALRMALGTREQHIKREKATSNICTAQALLANLSAFYAMYHGPAGLNQIATRINSFAQYSSKKLREYGYNVLSKESEIFDTVCIQNVESDKIIAELAKKRINIRKIDEQTVCFSTNETTSVGDIDQLLSVLALFKGKEHTLKEFEQSAKYFEPISPAIVRKSKYLTQDAFNKIHSEHQMLRFLYKLQLKDISLANSMIPLGSCTMKLNPTSCMIPITWPEFGNIHPFAPQDQCEGYKIMIDDLCEHLKVVTGFDAVSLQPNSGAQGELTGLLVIRKYVGANRNIVLIPHSAHGTNPASTAMAGLNVVEVKCDKAGNVDVADPKAKADKYKDKLACLMITYPSTHGVFESSIREMIDYVHKCGGQVYMDGANMNAQCGFTSPGFIGADVCHLNLHKTFAIPHGGGGPGVGPIAVKKHLAPLLPTHPIINMGGSNSIGTVSAAPYGSASILPISWVYLRGLGKEGVIKATATAILNANYLMSRLKEHYKILFTGENGRCAHEFLIDLREFKKSGITESDVAKRLMDFGIHSPTMSFPVAGTLMTEPTESEDKGELDRFCDAMIEIRKEIQDVIDGKSDVHNNPLVNAPHCLDHVTSTEWKHPYSREKAAYPLPWVKLRGKFWPTVGRIDNVYGDKNLKLVYPDKYEQL
jgi:glycine dehydrogenase